MQNLAFLNDQLAREVEGAKAHQLLARLDETLSAMTGMLNALLGNDQNELRNVQLEKSSCNKCACQAQIQGLLVRFVHCNDILHSGPQLLEDMHHTGWRKTEPFNISGLTVRQRQIMDMVLDGQPSKNIAADLNISQRTVENHRAAIMKRTGAKSLPALARLALAASPNTAPVSTA